MTEVHVVTIWQNDEEPFIDSIWTSAEDAIHRCIDAEEDYYGAEATMDTFPLNEIR